MELSAQGLKMWRAFKKPGFKSLFLSAILFIFYQLFSKLLLLSDRIFLVSKIILEPVRGPPPSERFTWFSPLLQWSGPKYFVSKQGNWACADAEDLR